MSRKMKSVQSLFFFNIRSILLTFLVMLLLFLLIAATLFFTGGALALPLIGTLLISFAPPYQILLAAAALTGLAFILFKLTQAVVSRESTTTHSFLSTDTAKSPGSKPAKISLRSPHPLNTPSITIEHASPILHHHPSRLPISSCIDVLYRIARIRQDNYHHNPASPPATKLTIQERSHLNIMQCRMEKNPEILSQFIKTAMNHILQSPGYISDAINYRESIIKAKNKPLRENLTFSRLIDILSTFNRAPDPTDKYKLADRSRIFVKPLHIEPTVFAERFPHGLSNAQTILYDAVLHRIGGLIFDLFYYGRPLNEISTERQVQLRSKYKQLQKNVFEIFATQLSNMPLIEVSQSDHNHSCMALTR